jgi:phosphomethylpyrimidine synthase
MSMNTALSGSGRVDDIQSHPQGGFRGQTNLVKITEDVRKYAAEQGLTNAEAIESGMEEKRKEFVEQGSEVYAKT